MNSKHVAAVRLGIFKRAFVLLSMTLLALAFAPNLTAQSSTRGQLGPEFDKSFVPATIGPGSTSTLRFDIINNDQINPVDDLAFTDNLPASVTIASPAQGLSDCGGTLSAPEGSATISLTGGGVAPGATCSIFVNVTSSAPGTHTNTSGDLTSSAGNSGPAIADLNVVTSLPGFTKTFSSASAPLGSRSTLTFTIDNTLNPAPVANLDFTDNLPTGLMVADPANASTDCGSSTFPTTLTAIPGTSVVTLDANGAAIAGFAAVDSGATCSVSLDVVSEGVGALDNVSEDLLADFVATGRAVDTLTSTAGEIVLVKEFLADPVPPGGSVDLEFTILNRTRSDDATNVEFTDALEATLSGLVATGLPTSVCGGTVSGTSTLSFAGGLVPAASECSFTVTLQVPAGAAPGIYPNVTTAVTADLGGAPTTGNLAADDLFVFAAPVLEKTFLDDPAPTGGSTRLEFTITNTSPTSVATDLAFIDELTTFLPFPVSVSLPADGFCGAGSNLSLISLGLDGQGLSMTGGNLAAGDSCTFEVTIDLPAGLSSGVYTNTTREITATVDGDNVVGSPASADLEVVAPPRLVKSFTDDPVQPGETVTLEFTLEHDEFAPGDATSIAFDDNLDATLSGLTSLDLPLNDICGSGSQISESMGVLSLTGGVLAPGESCTFATTLQVPMAASPGTYPNATTAVTATVSGLATTGLAASDDLLITGLSFTKQFIDDPVIAGDTATLRFTIDNDGSVDATGMSFTDDLDASLAGLAATGLPASGICGAGSSISGTDFLIFSGGNLLAGDSCSFDITVQVPAGTADGAYPNITSNLNASEGGTPVSLPPAADNLVVDSTLLSLSKEFLDDPVTPGATANLRFTLENNSGNTVTDIGFTDDLDAALSGLQVTGAIPLAPCGTGSSVSGSSLLTFSGGNLAANDSCTFQLTVEVPAAAPAGLYTNTTSDATGEVAGGLTVTGLAATDDFRVVNVNFTKSFDGPSVAGGAPVLNFTITNEGGNGISALAFTDDLNAVLTGLEATGLPLSNICGNGSSISGTTFLTFLGGSLGPNESCSFGVPLAVPTGTAPGSYANVTSPLSSAGLFTASPASANLSIQPAPTFGKVFADPAIAIDGTTRLTFTIDNIASVVAATGLNFVDNLPVGLEVAGTPNASTTCNGGTLTAVAGSGAISYTGGEVAAGASCTLAIDVTGTSEGTFVNTSGALTSSSGDSGSASDQIDVVSGDFVVTKSFRTEPVLPAGLVEMEISIVNGSAFPLVDIALTDDLDATLTGLVAEGLPVADVCGAGSEISGASTISLTGGSLGPGSSCTIVVPVRVPGDAPEGTFPNTTSTAAGQRGGVPVEADPGTADLVVADLTFEKSVDPSVAPQDSTVTATFTITNPDPANMVSALSFSDDLDQFVAGMTALNTPIVDACGLGSMVDGTGEISLTGGALGGGGSCTFEVTLQIPPDTSGDFLNETSTLTGEVDGTGITVPIATAALTVPGAPDFSKTFSPAAALVGGVSTLTFVIDNSASLLDADTLAFDDNLPVGMAVASTPAASNGCGGTLTAGPDTGLIQLTGGSVAAGAVCQIQVDVTANTSGTLTNVSDDLTSSLGNSGTSSDSIDVVSGEFTVTKAFLSQPVLPGGLVDLEFSITNDSSFPLADIALTDDLSAALAGLAAEGLPLADVCGAGSQVDGGAVASLTDGTLDPNASCTFVVQVRVPGNAPAGTFVNTTEIATATRQGVAVEAGPASADLVVEPLDFTKAFDPALAPAGGTATATFEIINPDPANAVTGLTFTDDLEAFVPGMTAANTPINDACGAGSLVDGTSTITLTDGAIAAGGSCTIQVVLNIPAETIAGDFTNTTSALTSTSGNTQTSAAASSAVLGIQPLPGFAKAFSPDAIAPGETTTLTFLIDNSGSLLDADALAFEDNLPTGTTIDAAPAVSNTCGGTLTAEPGTGLIQLLGGSVAAGATCQIQVDVTANTSGTLTNVSGDLTSSLGNSGNATATLTVSQAIPVPLSNTTWLALLALMLAALGWNAMNTRRP